MRTTSRCLNACGRLAMEFFAYAHLARPQRHSTASRGTGKFHQAKFALMAVPQNQNRALNRQPLRAPTSSRDCCLWKILLLIFVIVGLIVLNIHSHCVDIVTPDPSQGVAGRLISQEEPPAVSSLADNRARCVGGAWERLAIDVHLTVLRAA